MKSKKMMLRMASMAALAIALSNAEISQVAGQQIKIGEVVQVSKARPGLRHKEVQIGASPTDPNVLIGCSMHEPGTIAYLTRDRGATWEPAVEPAPSGTGITADPTCAIGRDGRLYFAILRTGGTGPTGRRIELYRSADGRSWGTPQIFPFMDREYITIDNTGGKYDGRVYINATSAMSPIDGGDAATALGLMVSADGGPTFSTNSYGLAFGDGLIRKMGNSVVLSDGTLVTVYGYLPARRAEPARLLANAQIKAAIFTDGGAQLAGIENAGRWFMHQNSIGGIPSTAVDASSGPFKDRIYSVFPDVRNGTVEIFMISSSNKGKTWTPPRKISDGPTRFWGDNESQTEFTMMPAIAVNKDGVVGVSWYLRSEGNEPRRSVRFTASFDGGETFLPSVELNKYSGLTHSNKPLIRAFRGSLITIGAFLPQAAQLGDTGGLAADAAGSFHPFWIDNPVDLEELWTTRIDVDGRAYRNGTAELAELDDVTTKLQLTVSDEAFDRKTNIFSINIKLKNSSKDTIRAPFKLRLVDFAADLGDASVIAPDNGTTKQGAIWDFTPQLVNGILAPNQGVSRMLKFKIDNLDMKRFTLYDGGAARAGLVRTSIRALGKIDKPAN